jgi:hypothetical protein
VFITPADVVRIKVTPARPALCLRPLVLAEIYAEVHDGRRQVWRHLGLQTFPGPGGLSSLRTYLPAGVPIRAAQTERGFLAGKTLTTLPAGGMSWWARGRARPEFS